jgi:hypothetical protein
MTTFRVRNVIGPTLAGTLAPMSVYVTLAAAFGPTEPLLGGRFSNWVVGMIVGSVLALVVAITLLLSDLALLRWRAVPTGRRAFGSAAVATVLAGCVHAVARPGRYDGLAAVVAVLAPVVASAVASRWVFGRPVPRD